jgi:hemin uptake protein HemP
MTAPKPPRPEPQDATAPARARLSSRDLFRGERAIVILHAGHEYLLRITRADKLILTK